MLIISMLLALFSNIFTIWMYPEMTAIDKHITFELHWLVIYMILKD